MLFLDFFSALFYNTFMKYIELTIHTTTEASELVCDLLWEYTEGGVAVSDSADVIALQSGRSGVFWDYLDEGLKAPRTDVLVKAFLQPSRAGEIPEILSRLREMAARSGGEIPFGTLEDTKREIDGDDWIDVWKKHFRPIHLGRIVVVPEWIAYEKRPDEEIVLLDSNMAFGTGEHETTSMCVELLQKYLRAGDTVLDVGCGSGILGISAAKLGAGKCYLTDIDPIAVDSARHNAQKNGVGDRVSVAESNLVGEAAIQADVVLANITAEVLVLLAPDIKKYLKTGGTVILSGIIEDRLDKVRSAFFWQGMSEVSSHKKGEWYALVLK